MFSFYVIYSPTPLLLFTAPSEEFRDCLSGRIFPLPVNGRSLLPAYREKLPFLGIPSAVLGKCLRFGFSASLKLRNRSFSDVVLSAVPFGTDLFVEEVGELGKFPGVPWIFQREGPPPVARLPSSR